MFITLVPPVKCPVIDIISGRVSPQEVVFDTSVQITCSPGFKLSGANQLHCGPDGSRTPNVPNCEPVTCSPPVVENGMINGERPWYKPKDTMIIMCRRGFMIGSPHITWTRWPVANLAPFSISGENLNMYGL
ncbi:C4b-binding protein alpha chain-like [Myxocyprinus asiaticus]|uniref:C4b-binding protein alpha chain-like n=1 Tax=Myxocyprinus asiaticus TaxID=70543 RepID=UPI00222311BE|nr:C4b-binding protein alpha chain-like [Myxocyprinus asiaticus]